MGLCQRDNKRRSTNEKKKGEKNEQRHKPKKTQFKGKYKFCNMGIRN